MGYLKHSVKGITWVALLRVFTRALSFGKIAIIARLLSPLQFGLFGIASIVLAFIEIVTETGINVFLIQENEKEVKKYINTAWIVSIVRGVIVFLLIVFSSPFIVFFFNAPGSFDLILLISLVPLVRGFINPSVAFLQKELQFQKEFYLKSFIFIIDALTSVILVYFLKSPSGIIYGLLVGGVVEVILSFLVVSPRPYFEFKVLHIQHILHRGKWVTVSGIFNYLYHNIDDVLVGKIINIGSLGLYSMVYKISTLPISEVADVISRVSFPVYVKIAGDKVRLKTAFLKTGISVSLLSIPLGALCILFPKEIILIILGEKWISAWPTLQVLGFFGIIRSISGTTSALFLSVNKQEYVALVTFVSFIGLIVTIVPLINMYGIIGAAIASVIGSVVALPIMAYYTVKIFYEKS